MPARAPVETVKTLKKAISANTALAELRASGQLIPNQALLIRAIVLQEAKVSSEIENVVTTSDELYRAFSDKADNTDPATKEVLRYQEALWKGNEMLQRGFPLNADLFLDIVQTIKDPAQQIRSASGTRIVNSRGQAVYTPPDGQDRLRALLDNLSEYIYSNDGVDPLIKMAVIHYQFEAIHPFSDGNGRTGRVLNILYLVEKKLLAVPVLYLSRYIIHHRKDYYSGLLNVTLNGAWEDWILYMLEAVETTALATRQLIVGIRDAMSEATEIARSQMKRGYKKELIELVFQQPYTRISSLEQAGIAKRDAASEYLRELERIGLLTSQQHGRERLFYNRRLLEILTAEPLPKK